MSKTSIFSSSRKKHLFLPLLFLTLLFTHHASGKS
jgi:hypothetical protein